MVFVIARRPARRQPMGSSAGRRQRQRAARPGRLVSPCTRPVVAPEPRHRRQAVAPKRSTTGSVRPCTSVGRCYSTVMLEVSPSPSSPCTVSSTSPEMSGICTTRVTPSTSKGTSSPARKTFSAVPSRHLGRSQTGLATPAPKGCCHLHRDSYRRSRRLLRPRNSHCTHR